MDGWMQGEEEASSSVKLVRDRRRRQQLRGSERRGKKVKGNVAFVKELETSFEIMLGNNGPGSCYGDSGDTLILWGGTKCPS